MAERSPEETAARVSPAPPAASVAAAAAAAAAEGATQRASSGRAAPAAKAAPGAGSQFGGGSGGGGQAGKSHGGDYTAGIGGGGGGGLGAGGDIFVQGGGILTLAGGQFADGVVKGGASGGGYVNGGAGGAYGGGIFIQGGTAAAPATITLGAGQTAGQTTTISGGIADEAGSVSGAAGVGGVIVAGLGTVALDAADTYAGGTLVDAGATLEIGAADEIGSGALTLDAGATLETIGVFAMANRISLAGLAHFDIAASDALTLSGPIGDGAQAGGLVLEGLGALTLTGADAFSGGATIDAGARLFLSGAGGLGAGGVLVDAGGTLDVETGDVLDLSGTSSVIGLLEGAGTLDQLGGSATFELDALLRVADWTLSPKATATIAENLVYAGKLSTDAASNLAIDGGDVLTLTGKTSLAGSVAGAGTLMLRGGVATIAGSALLSMARWTISGATATLSAATGFAGALLAEFGATIDGAGALTTSGATTVSGLTIGGAVAWTNDKTITEKGGALTLGNSSGAAASLINAKTGVFDFVDDDGIGLGKSAASSISNSGLIGKTAGTGVSAIAAGVVNDGTISATSGTLDLRGALTGTGALRVGDGATLELDGSVAAGQRLAYLPTGGEIYLDDLDAAGAQLFHGTVTGWAAGASLDVGTTFGTGTTFDFVENAGKVSGVLHVADGAASAAIAFAGDFTTANFTPSVNASGATVLTFHA